MFSPNQYLNCLQLIVSSGWVFGVEFCNLILLGDLVDFRFHETKKALLQTRLDHRRFDHWWSYCCFDIILMQVSSINLYSIIIIICICIFIRVCGSIHIIFISSVIINIDSNIDLLLFFPLSPNEWVLTDWLTDAWTMMVVSFGFYSNIQNVCIY